MHRWLMRLVMGFACVVAANTHAQDACESKCNQASAECLRVCVAKPTGDAKDQKGSQKEQSAKMMQCLNTCEAEAKPCREKCHPPKPEKPVDPKR